MNAGNVLRKGPCEREGGTDTGNNKQSCLTQVLDGKVGVSIMCWFVFQWSDGDKNGEISACRRFAASGGVAF